MCSFHQSFQRQVPQIVLQLQAPGEGGGPGSAPALWGGREVWRDGAQEVEGVEDGDGMGC